MHDNPSALASPAGRAPSTSAARSALLIATVSLLGGSAVAQGNGFTADEQRRLLAGDLVTRNVSRTEGVNELYGGTSWMRVRAPIARVWETVSDPAAYPHLIPSLDRVRVVEEDGDDRVLYMHHSYAISETEYHARMHLDHAQHEMRFELDRSRPHEMRAGRGFIALSAYRGDTIVAWGMVADVGAGMLMQIFGPFLNEWLLLPPRCVRDLVEPGREPSC